MTNEYRKMKNFLLEEKELSPKQQAIAKLDPPADKIDAGDFKAMRAGEKPKNESDTEKSFDIILKNGDKIKNVKFFKNGEWYQDTKTGRKVGGKVPEGAKVVNEENQEIKEGQDHEVSMAQNSLKSIISSASQLMNLLGQDEKDVPAWIQDHITNAENFINQASKNYHEYNGGEHDMDELPDGTEELPAGDAEDTEMSLQSLMEIGKGKKKRK